MILRLPVQIHSWFIDDTCRLKCDVLKFIYGSYWFVNHHTSFIDCQCMLMCSLYRCIKDLYMTSVEFFHTPGMCFFRAKRVFFTPWFDFCVSISYSLSLTNTNAPKAFSYKRIDPECILFLSMTLKNPRYHSEGLKIPIFWSRFVNNSDSLFSFS